MVYLNKNNEMVDVDVVFYDGKMSDSGESHGVKICTWKDIHEGTTYSEDIGQVRTRSIADIVSNNVSLGFIREVLGIKPEHTKLEFVPDTREVGYYEIFEKGIHSKLIKANRPAELNVDPVHNYIHLYSHQKEHIGNLVLEEKRS